MSHQPDADNQLMVRSKHGQSQVKNLAGGCPGPSAAWHQNLALQPLKFMVPGPGLICGSSRLGHIALPFLILRITKRTALVLNQDWNCPMLNPETQQCWGPVQGSPGVWDRVTPAQLMGSGWGQLPALPPQEAESVT